MNYDYQMDRYGGVTLYDNNSGKDIYIQGEEGSELFDELEEMDEKGIEWTLSEYFACIEK